MIKIGITGQAGFIGTHLYNTLSLNKDMYKCIPFKDEYFQREETFGAFVKQCDVIVHLAAMNRHNDPHVLFKTNIDLVSKLISSLDRTDSRPYVIMSSSLQEERDNLYGRSKREGRELIQQWAGRKDARFTGLIIPNVFGPFGVPYYNSVISTFSHQLMISEEPKIEVDAALKLIYVGDLVKEITDLIDAYADISVSPEKTSRLPQGAVPVMHRAEYKVTEILAKLKGFHKLYVVAGVIPDLSDYFDLCLFNTFRSYLPDDFFPRPYKRNCDNRGEYVEICRSEGQGQSAYSTTLPKITRGNHFHTRKVERFAVIKGKASIKLRKFGCSSTVEYILDGEQPGYVDMPVWVTHNLTNIGSSELVTMFWINEFYDPSDPDTFFEEV